MRKALVILAVIAFASTAMAQDIIVTELMYNSIGTDVEWIELYNRSDADVDLTGWTITDTGDGSHVPGDLDGIMAPGDVMVFCISISMFNVQYPTVTNYFADQSSGNWGLGNGGDDVFLIDSTGTQVFGMSYDDNSSWPACDGDGPSLTLIDADCVDFSDGANWTTSSADWGTPGIIETTVSNDETSFGAVKALFR
ncbi:lamin tail domain-containing protein [bacterium]|nr:lamin tail domain-containing protein [bacterium]MBT7311877.1 lamin tail domain-containing protein [bacterium]